MLNKKLCQAAISPKIIHGPLQSLSHDSVWFDKFSTSSMNFYRFSHTILAENMTLQLPMTTRLTPTSPNICQEVDQFIINSTGCFHTLHTCVHSISSWESIFSNSNPVKTQYKITCEGSPWFPQVYQVTYIIPDISDTPPK